MGDVFLSLQAIRTLRYNYPHHDFCLLTRPDVGQLLMACGEISGFWDIGNNALGEMLSNSDSPSLPMLKEFERCTHVMVWINHGKHELKQFFQQRGIDEVIIQSPHDESLASTHVEDRFLETISPFAQGGPSKRIPLSLSTTFVSQNHEIKLLLEHESFILVHPGSGSPHKCVSISLLGKVIHEIRNRFQKHVVIVAGYAEEDMAKQLKIAVSEDWCSLVSGLNLVALTQLMKQASCYLGNDSGITHLAAVLGLPTLAFFGPTDPDQWAPRAPGVRVLHGPPCQCQTWSEVQSCASKPCLEFPVPTVLATIEELLEANYST